MIKKVVIAAAGQGTRMLHLTKEKSKHLIRVKKRPFLAYLLDNLFLAGYRDLILVTGFKEELIEEFLNRYKPPLKSLRKSQYKIRMVSQYEILGPKDKMYGTACPLMCVKDIVKKSQFIYLCGDNLYSVRDLKAMNIGGNHSYVAGIYQKNPEKYGVLVGDDGFLLKIVEKPKEFIGNLVNTGLYKFTFDIFDKLGKIKKSPRGEYEITDAINLLARKKKVKIQKIKDFWLDFGNPADIIKISYFLRSFKKFKELFWKHKDFEIISYRARDVVEKAVEFLERGQVVVCPTDTVYGLLADATNDKAVEKVFEIKRRDKKKAIPIFVKDMKMAKKLALMNKNLEEFLEEIWPGKITVALKRKERCSLPKTLFGRKETIGLRIPDYKLVAQILKKINKPLTSTSANISGRASSTKIREILEQFEEQEVKPDLILDAGNLSKSFPSTVVDFSEKKPKILRKGR
ncbi:threonylcarbamoyl-AMP synthase [Patescibacteria group bacterium]|nr:threonylcarbamoyl-AMP synthase [Patescibacteria group bacterium]